MRRRSPALEASWPVSPDVTRLEDLTKGALISGVLADRPVRVVDVAWHGSNAITLTYTDEPTGKVDQELLYRDDEPRLTVEVAGRAWSMDADGNLFRLVSDTWVTSVAPPPKKTRSPGSRGSSGPSLAVASYCS